MKEYREDVTEKGKKGERRPWREREYGVRRRDGGDKGKKGGKGERKGGRERAVMKRYREGVTGKGRKGERGGGERVRGEEKEWR